MLQDAAPVLADGCPGKFPAVRQGQVIPAGTMPFDAERAQRFQDDLEIAKSKDVIIQDRTLFEGVEIFVANNHDMGNLSDRDYDTYMQLFRLMMSMVAPPDLLIYLRCSVPHLVDQIQKRGRDYEQTMSLEYLSGLNERYEQWIARYQGRLLAIDADHLDFENRPEDFALITDKIDAELFGLFK